MLDSFKELGFHFASQAGITISKNDVVAPPDKEEILERYENESEEIMGQYDEGYITAEERKEAVTELSGTRPPRRSARRWRTTSTSSTRSS